jgi:zinc protease
MRSGKVIRLVLWGLVMTLGVRGVWAIDLGLPKKYRLRNGLRLVTLRDRSMPLVGMALVVPAGSSGETVKTNGYGHVLADLWGNLAFSPQSQALKERLEERGARYFSRYDEHWVAGLVTLPSEDWRLALELAALYLQTGEVSRDSLEEARSRVLRKLAKKARFPREQGALVDKLRSLAYPGHPQGLSEDGNEQAVRRLTPSLLAEHLRPRLRPNGVVLALVGDLPELDPLLEEAMQRFAMPAGRSLPPEATAFEPKASELREAAEVKKTVAAVGFRVPGLEHPDYPALALIEHLLGTGAGSLLHRRLVMGEGLLASVSSKISRLPGHNLLRVELDSVGTSMDGALRSVLQTCVSLGKRPLSMETLENVRQGVKTSHALEAQRRSSRALHLARAELFDLSDLILEMPERLDQVTPRELARVAKRYLRPDRAQIVVLHPRGAEEKPSGEVLWRRFTGGVEVVFERETSTEVVGLSLAFPGGTGVQPADKPGLSALLEAYLAAAGTSLESPIETERRLQRHGTDIYPLSGGTWGSGVGLTATVYGFEELLTTLQRSVLHPRWDADTFRRVRDEVREKWRLAVERPYDFGLWRSFEELYPGGGHVPIASKIWQQLPTYTLEDLRALHTTLLEKPRWVLGVSGNLGASRISRAVSHSFAVKELGPGIKGRGLKKMDHRGKPGVRLKKEAIEAGYDTLWAGFRLPGVAAGELAPLTVWFNLLGYSSDSLLKRELKSLDPSMEAIWHSVMVPPTGGVMLLGFRMKAGTGSLAAQRVKKILEGLETQPVDQKRLDQTARRIRAALLINSQEKLQQAATLATNTEESDWPTVRRDLIQSYAHLTLKETRKAAREYLRSGVVLLFEGKK